MNNKEKNNSPFKRIEAVPRIATAADFDEAKPKKYTHDRRAPGSKIETPYTHNDTRRKKVLDLANLEGEPVISFNEGTLTIKKSHD